MKRSGLFLLALALAATACNKEKRKGQLSLAGSSPVRIADQGGSTVDFYNGPLQVEFGADGRKVSVKLEQNGRVARFSAKVPQNLDWNFTARGSEIGQPVDLVSRRAVQLYGPIEERTGLGGSCGFNGSYVTEEQWRKGNEDWSVSFSDAQSSQSLGAFKSRREGESYLVASRNLWCRERREPGGGHWDRHAANDRWNGVSARVAALQDNGVSW